MVKNKQEFIEKLRSARKWFAGSGFFKQWGLAILVLVLILGFIEKVVEVDRIEKSYHEQMMLNQELANANRELLMYKAAADLGLSSDS